MEQKNIKFVFAKYVFLNVLGTLGFSCYILADTIFIARGMGADGLTALNLALPVFSVIMGLGLMIGVGGGTRFTLSKSDDVYSQSIYYVSLLSILFIVAALFFSDNIASLLGADKHILPKASIYLKTIMLFAPFFLLNNVVQAFVRNDGRPGLAMTAMLLGSLSNIVLDYIFIFELNMGMFGAALATVSAPVLGLTIMSIHFFAHHNNFRFIAVKPRLIVFKDISALGISALITEFSSGVVIVVFNYVILGLSGNIGVAAYSIIANIALVIMSIYLGISQGIQPLFSEACRLKQAVNLKNLLRYSFVTSFVVSMLICLLSIVFAEPIVSAFNKDNDFMLANLAVEGMKTYFWAFLFVGINIVCATYFGAVDKPRPAFVISFLRGFVVLVPMVVAMSALFGMTGVWLAMTCSEMIVLGIALLLMKKKF